MTKTNAMRCVSDHTLSPPHFCKNAAFLGTNLEPWRAVSIGRRNRSRMKRPRPMTITLRQAATPRWMRLRKRHSTETSAEMKTWNLRCTCFAPIRVIRKRLRVCWHDKYQDY